MANLTNDENEMVTAVMSGDFVALQSLDENGVSIHFEVDESSGTSLLHLAALLGHLECAKCLLAMGIDASVEDTRGLKPLHSCVSRPLTDDRAKIVKLLLATGVSLEEKCNIGNSVLHQASAFSDAHMVQFLVDIGANVNATNNDNLTPLHFACNYAEVGNAYKLLDNGADLFARNVDGRTPVDVAGDQNLKASILTYKLGTVSHANTQLRQEVHDLKNLLKNLILATAFGNMDRTGSSTTTTMLTPSDGEEVWV